MPSCSRFYPTLAIAFVYALVIPSSILLRMGASGWAWILNDPAWGLFMLAVFPFAVAVFCCIVDVELLMRSVTNLSQLTGIVVILAAMLLVVARGVVSDMRDTHRARQPYMLSDSHEMDRLAKLHADAFESGGSTLNAESYVAQARLPINKLNSNMVRLFSICNFINVSFGVFVFCYILLASVNGPIARKSCNHMIFTLVALATWFPMRAYADWFINLTDMSWVSTYAAAWVMALLLVVSCFILAMRMLKGSLYKQLAIPAASVSAVIAAIAAIKPAILSRAALAIARFDPIYTVGLALALISFLYYASMSVHQRN
jgi:hypothetical protein